MTVATELIEGILRDFPDHRAGTRPVHAFGTMARGWFRPNDVAGRLTVAAPFHRPAGVPATVRFSSGTGDAGVPEWRRDVRGMAVRLGGDDAPFDLVSMTLPVFFVRTVDDFRGFTRAAEPPRPPVTVPWWRPLLDLLNLRAPLADPAPGDAGVARFSAGHPESCPALVGNFNAGIPESFATRAYHAVHAFVLTDTDGATCSVRFSWEPVAGVRDTLTTAERYLAAELAARGARSPVGFVLRGQIAEQGDDTSDPTRPWPRSRKRVVLGQLTLDTFGTGSGEDLEFDPHHLPPGIGGDPGDEIFAVRGEVYRESARIRRQVRPGPV
ncbi:MAG: catalase [Acidimicrobiales bacterium]